MSKLWKTIISIFSVVVVGVAGILLYIYWPAIKGTINSNKYYTAEDLQDSYDKGFDDGNKSETELTAEITYYKNLVDEYEVEVASLNKEINDLTTKKLQNEEKINELTLQKNNLQNQISELSSINLNNDNKIATLNKQINDLQTQISSLTTENSDKNNQITYLNNQVENLQNTVNQLQLTNEMNLNTIASLNNQVAYLNKQISELSLSSGSWTTQIKTLNGKINELQASVNYYESYISNLKTNDQVVATFEYDGSIYNVQIINKDSQPAFPIPEDTDYKIFNGWKVDGELIDTSNYNLSASTRFIADITYKFDVNFIVDNSEYNSQLVIKNNSAILPSNPIKAGYEFDGWSINGVDIIENIDSIQVIENTIYTAIFTKVHTVTFKHENNIIETQIIRNNTCAIFVDVEDETYKEFNGWKIDNSIIDVSSYVILKDTTFVADITYKFDVIYIVDGSEYHKEIVAYNQYLTLPANPDKKGYFFDGWTINGVDVIDVINYRVLDTTTFIAKFSEITYLTTVEEVTFNGDTRIYGPNVWYMDGEVYFSQDTRHYILDKETRTWNKVTWNGVSSFDGNYVWTDGLTYYYSKSTIHYVLDKETSTWSKKVWNNCSTFFGSSVWSIGENLYMISSSNGCYIFNKETKDWNIKDWKGFAPDHAGVWTDGTNYYYSYKDDQYVFNQVTGIWEEKTWYGLTSFYSGSIFVVNGNAYYSNGNDQYMLNKETDTWEVKNWIGLTWSGGAPKNIYGSSVWTDGTNVYYTSNGDVNYLIT